MATVEKKMLDEDVEKLVDGEEEYDGIDCVDTVILSDEDSLDRLELESHKENPEKNDDDKKKNDKKDDDDNDDDDHALIRNRVTGSSDIKTEKRQTPISSPPKSPKTDLSSNKMKSDLQAQLANSELWDVLRAKFDKSSASAASCRNDAFRMRDHDEHKGDDAPPEGEKKCEKAKDVEKLKDAWVDTLVINEDELILEDETPELIDEFQNVDKRVSTIFDHERMEATIKDMLRNQHEDLKRPKPDALVFYGPQRNPNEPPRYLYNKDLFFLKNGNTEKKWYVLSLHKIHAISFLEEDLEEKMNRWRMYNIDHKKVRDDPKKFFSDYIFVKIVKTDQQYGIDYMERLAIMRENDKPDSFSEADFKYLNKKDIEDMYY
ncbi:hypothetical protein Tco_1433557 [Tanacetum coccineum]